MEKFDQVIVSRLVRVCPRVANSLLRTNKRFNKFIKNDLNLMEYLLEYFDEKLQQYLDIQLKRLFNMKPDTNRIINIRQDYNLSSFCVVCSKKKPKQLNYDDLISDDTDDIEEDNNLIEDGDIANVVYNNIPGVWRIDNLNHLDNDNDKTYYVKMVLSHTSNDATKKIIKLQQKYLNLTQAKNKHLLLTNNQYEYNTYNRNFTLDLINDVVTNVNFKRINSYNKEIQHDTEKENYYNYLGKMFFLVFGPTLWVLLGASEQRPLFKSILGILLFVFYIYFNLYSNL